MDLNGNGCNIWNEFFYTTLVKNQSKFNQYNKDKYSNNWETNEMKWKSNSIKNTSRINIMKDIYFISSNQINSSCQK